ncbi:unnamed protein product [Clonostachys solani]|uniref:Uncharacterized protein n=1 Tax=Clonostachys solani TaxID=160281 RepID=A0A9N9Z0R1_9HYPO|nr:unnamed protein product [Clonostachys solani]
MSETATPGPRNSRSLFNRRYTDLKACNGQETKVRTTSGDTLSLGAGVVRTAGVAGLGADTGLGEAGDTSLGVADGNTEGANGAAVDTSGRAGAADAGSNRRGGATRHREATAAVVVDVTPEGGSTDSADEAHVGAAWED